LSVTRQAYKPLCTSSERIMSVQWGKLAADTLTQNYDAATEDLLRLRESLDNQSFATPLMQLQQRTWLMHWSLHVFWNTENGKNSLIDLFLQPAYMSAIQINAQHLLRYLAAAVVVNRKRRNVLRELIKVIQQESYEYSDPITQVRPALLVCYLMSLLFLVCYSRLLWIAVTDCVTSVCQHVPVHTSAPAVMVAAWYCATAHSLTPSALHRLRPPLLNPALQFLECLFVHYDFDGAQQKLIECESVIEHDYFLTAIKAEFLESARLFIFETYCRIHQCINIDMLSERLNMDKEAAEKWIANLILSARLNAKIDSKAGTVVMGLQSSSMQDQLADKAKQLSVRTFTLANAVVGAPATKA
jgi:hypothetical protein